MKVHHVSFLHSLSPPRCLMRRVWRTRRISIWGEYRSQCELSCDPIFRIDIRQLDSQSCKQPGALEAVDGSATGWNSVCVLVPCHGAHVAKDIGRCGGVLEDQALDCTSVQDQRGEDDENDEGDVGAGDRHPVRDSGRGVRGTVGDVGEVGLRAERDIIRSQGCLPNGIEESGQSLGEERSADIRKVCENLQTPEVGRVTA